MEKGNIEAHRMIALSLGKIAATRRVQRQRGGINLHKSLLVCAVLHKARNVYMTGNLQTIVQARTVSQEMEVYECESQSQEQLQSQCMELSENAKSEAGTERTCDQERVHTSKHFTNNNKENTQPCPESNMQSEQSVSSDSVGTNLSNISNKNIENISSENRCSSRCAKRRLATVCDNVNMRVSKKLKSDSDQSFSDRPEPMQTESSQITNLVSSFNSGFTGLLNGKGTTPIMQGQGHWEVQPYSYSNQTVCGHIKEGFESLARPIIALAV